MWPARAARSRQRTGEPSLRAGTMVGGSPAPEPQPPAAGGIYSGALHRVCRIGPGTESESACPSRIEMAVPAGPHPSRHLISVRVPNYAKVLRGITCTFAHYTMTRLRLRAGYRWSPVRTLPVAPLWCDLRRFSRTVAVINLRRTSAAFVSGESEAGSRTLPVLSSCR